MSKLRDYYRLIVFSFYRPTDLVYSLFQCLSLSLMLEFSSLKVAPKNLSKNTPFDVTNQALQLDTNDNNKELSDLSLRPLLFQCHTHQKSLALFFAHPWVSIECLN